MTKQLTIYETIFITNLPASFKTVGLMAQTVSGILTDENGDALIQDRDVEFGTENGSIADTKGSYLLTLTKDNPGISDSYTGYQTEQLTYFLTQNNNT